MTGETPGGLTEAERESLTVALYKSRIGEYGYFGRLECEQFTEPLVPAVEAILAARAQPSGQDATTALERVLSMPHENWCCAKGCTHLHGPERPGCTCLVSLIHARAALASDAGQQGGGV